MRALVLTALMSLSTVCVFHDCVHSINPHGPHMLQGQAHAHSFPRINFPLTGPTQPHNKAVVLGGTVGSNDL